MKNDFKNPLSQNTVTYIYIAKVVVLYCYDQNKINNPQFIKRQQFKNGICKSFAHQKLVGMEALHLSDQKLLESIFQLYFKIMMNHYKKNYYEYNFGVSMTITVSFKHTFNMFNNAPP